MDLSITIASYNSRDVTRRTLQSIFEQTQGIRYEVIVVDNASVDGTSDMIEKEFPSVRVIRTNRNRGFAAAYNSALRTARGRCLLVLNSDVLFIDNAAKNMVEQLLAAPDEIGVLGPKILNPDGSYAPSSSYRQFHSRILVGLSAVNLYFPFVHLLPMSFLRRNFGHLLGNVHGKLALPVEAERVEWLDGVCILFKRETLEQAGLFDEQFFFDYEIGDLLIRVRSKGWGIIYVPHIKVVHFGGYSRKLKPGIMIENNRSCFIYYAKHKPEYIPHMRVVYLSVIRLKWLLVKLRACLPGAPDTLRENLKILNGTMKMLTDFQASSVKENQRVPSLPVARDRFAENP